MNPSYQEFADSVSKAFQEEVKPQHVVIFLFLLVFAFGLGFLSSWLYQKRKRLRRVFTHYWFRLLGRMSKDSRRFDLEAPLAIILPFSNLPTKRTATVNLSTGGMFIKTRDPFAKNTSFEFVLELPRNDRIQGSALVRWVKPLSGDDHPAGMGVEFLQLSEKDKNKIRAYLKERRLWRKKQFH